MSTPREQEFDRFATTYQQVLDGTVRFSGEGGTYFAAVKAQYVRNLVGATFSGTMLDYGCGVGLLAGLLKSYLPTAQLDGYDVSAASLQRVDPALAAQGQFTSHSDELQKNYDLIILSNVMHHIPLPERKGAVSELKARLAQLGKLVVFEHNPANPLTRWVVNHCPFDENVALLWPGEARAYLKNAGLRVLRRDYIVFFPRQLAWLRPLESRIRWVPLGAQYAIVGEQDA
jgi:SAM-dependent methyltransferase